MGFLESYGVTFYQTQKMTHAKIMIIDDSLALVGSSNIDALSFDFNAEIGVFFENEKMIADLRAIIEKWKENSVIFKQNIRFPFWTKVFFHIIRAFQPFL